MFSWLACVTPPARRVGPAGRKSDSTRASLGSIQPAERGLDARIPQEKRAGNPRSRQGSASVADQLDAVAVPPELHHAVEPLDAAGVLQRDRVAGGGRVLDGVEPVSVGNAGPD